MRKDEAAPCFRCSLWYNENCVRAAAAKTPGTEWRCVPLLSLPGPTYWRVNRGTVSTPEDLLNSAYERDADPRRPRSRQGQRRTVD